MAKKSKRDKEKSGRKPKLLKLENGWEEAVGNALKKPRPAQGWPKHQSDDEKTAST